jgi:hypothetical protein
MLQAGMDNGKWSFSGSIWSTGAGALGAIGALGIIYAFNFGGKPIFVMPLVFGFAPIINTIVSMSTSGTLSQISPIFVGSLATTIAGAVMVLVFQPSSKPHGKPPVPPTPKTELKSKAVVSDEYEEKEAAVAPLTKENHDPHAPATAMNDAPISSPDSALQSGKPDEPRS